jgi:hypothetical protein
MKLSELTGLYQMQFRGVRELPHAAEDNTFVP